MDAYFAEVAYWVPAIDLLTDAALKLAARSERERWVMSLFLRLLETDDMATLTVRISNDKHMRLKALAKRKHISVNKLLEDLSTHIPHSNRNQLIIKAILFFREKDNANYFRILRKLVRNVRFIPAFWKSITHRFFLRCVFVDRRS